MDYKQLWYDMFVFYYFEYDCSNSSGSGSYNVKVFFDYFIQEKFSNIFGKILNWKDIVIGG